MSNRHIILQLNLATECDRVARLSAARGTWREAKMSTNPPLKLTVPSDLGMLQVARAFVEAACLANDIDTTTTHAVVLAVSEAASNVVRHGHRERPEAQLQILCYFSDDSIAIDILDEGEPFDVTAVPSMDPSEIRVGGRGVFLMRALMDELICRPRPDRGNVLRMVKRFSKSLPARDCG
jgi:serine/threonine-protein kinase RsbW